LPDIGNFELTDKSGKTRRFDEVALQDGGTDLTKLIPR